MRQLTRTLAAATLGITLGIIPCLAAAEDVVVGDLQPVGLAWDADGERLFLASQSGQVQILDSDGGTVGEITFSGEPENVQGLALDDDSLHIADIGDASGDRDHITVFGVAPTDGHQKFKAWDFVYEDGPHEAKAFLISGKGRFYFVTDGDDPGIYASPLDPARDGVNTLTRSADAPEGVTDAAFLDDGDTMLVRSAEGVILIDAYTWEHTATTKYVDAPENEAITPFGPGRMLVGATETLRDEPLPDGETTVTPAPSQDQEEEPSETESEEPTEDPEPEEQPDADEKPRPGKVSRSGTMFALAGAVVVAMVAGIVVFFSKN